MAIKPANAPDVERRQARVRRVPSLFLAHGSPMTVIDKEYGKGRLERLETELTG